MNRLADTNSPYLLQHKDNPVHWYPWGDEAFEAAKRENKPVFLSIGYATCHWCHVMAHESFEDPEVARLMNEAFINVKVDREERPDVDAVYMSVCQMLTGHGGWPLTIIMTPDKRPFFAATYIPKESRFGRPGMMQLVPRVEALWNGERQGVLASAERITHQLRAQQPQAETGHPLDAGVLHRAYAELAERYDPEHGGFGRAPKFPTPHNLLFLLRYYHRRGEINALNMVTHTLRQMRAGGLYDHVGGGFHRYATDGHWLLPHFEKMLYDQALLVMAYTEAYQVTRDEDFADTARSILAYVTREMQAPEGGFYSAEDADSEGEEGTFYLWTQGQLADVLEHEDAAFFCRVFNCQPGGNFADEATGERNGANIPHRTKTDEVLATELDMSVAAFRDRLARVRQQVFEARATRVRPELDDKVLTDWNGLMIAACATAGRVLNEPVYVEIAQRAAAFIDAHLSGGPTLLHRYRNQESGIAAHLDDYAFQAWGLLELYAADFNPAHLARATALMETVLAEFWDAEAGGFFFTAKDAEPLLVRQKELYDGAVPSGNGVAATVLLRLARLTGQTTFEETADRLLRFAAATVNKYPAAYTQSLMALDLALGPTREVVIAAPDREAADRLLSEWRQVYAPRTVGVLRTPAVADALAAIAPWTEAHAPVGGKAAAYVCEHYACALPTTDPAAFSEQLGTQTEA